MQTAVYLFINKLQFHGVCIDLRVVSDNAFVKLSTTAWRVYLTNLLHFLLTMFYCVLLS